MTLHANTRCSRADCGRPEATRRIKAIPTLARMPIIAVTSYALTGD